MGNFATSIIGGAENRVILHPAGTAALPVPSGAPAAGLLAPWRASDYAKWTAGAFIRILGSDAALTVGGPVELNLCDDDNIWWMVGQFKGGSDLVGVSITRGFGFKVRDVAWAKAIALSSGAIVGGTVTVTIEPLLLREGLA